MCACVCVCASQLLPHRVSGYRRRLIRSRLRDESVARVCLRRLMRVVCACSWQTHLVVSRCFTRSAGSSTCSPSSSSSPPTSTTPSTSSSRSTSPRGSSSTTTHSPTTASCASPTASARASGSRCSHTSSRRSTASFPTSTSGRCRRCRRCADGTGPSSTSCMLLELPARLSGALMITGFSGLFIY